MATATRIGASVFQLVWLRSACFLNANTIHPTATHRNIRLANNQDLTGERERKILKTTVSIAREKHDFTNVLFYIIIEQEMGGKFAEVESGK